MQGNKTPLQKFEEQEKKKDCHTCKRHIKKKMPTGIIHFCGFTEKLLLYPDYIPNNCEGWDG